MNRHRFDSLTRSLTAVRYRRRALVAGLGALLWRGSSSANDAAAKKKKPCPPCKRRKKGKCKGKLPDGAPCETGTCLDGQCVTPVVPPPPPPAACGAGGPCLVFLSSTRQTANLGGLSGADAICQKLAKAAGLPGSYKAWLSDTTASASSRFVPNPGPYQLVNGAQVAASFADLTDGTILTGIDVTETGGSNGGSIYVWTGTLPNGDVVTEAGRTCANWTSDGATGGLGLSGYSNVTNSNWTASGLGSCGGTYHLYCFQQR